MFQTTLLLLGLSSVNFSIDPIVEVEGVKLPIKKSCLVNSRTTSLVPTETTKAKETLKYMASAWQNTGIIIDGKDQAINTNYARFLADLTLTPFKQYHISQSTASEDICGKWVPGKIKYSKKQLSKMSLKEINKVSSSLDITCENLDKNTCRDEIIVKQQQPKWEEGPLPRALRNGEVLCIHGIDLSNPELFNTLLKHFPSFSNHPKDRNGDIISVHPNAKIVILTRNQKFFPPNLDDNYGMPCSVVKVPQLDKDEYLDILKNFDQDNILTVQAITLLIDLHMWIEAKINKNSADRSNVSIIQAVGALNTFKGESAKNNSDKDCFSTASEIYEPLFECDKELDEFVNKVVEISMEFK